MIDTKTALARLESAVAEEKLSPSAAGHIRTWLTEPYLAEYAPQVAELLAQGKFKELDDAFWRIIPFGTGGRRGRLYPVGCNAINDRTIGESAQGLADYIKELNPGKALSCAIAYDPRHRSRDFAELCSEIMAAAGFTVYFLDGYRSTPELSFTIRYKQCDCGVIITASHNPPTDNAVKVYGPSGGQFVPPHDKRSIERMRNVTEIKRIPFQQAMDEGKVVYCQEEVDPAFIAAVEVQSLRGPRDLKIIYSPLQGVGGSAVPPVLAAVGFKDVEVFGPHATPDPDFTNVPNHISNPERPEVFDAMIERAKEIGAELILATDPDADRLGAAAPVSNAPGAEWKTLTGNQIGSLLTDYLLSARKSQGTLTPEHYVVKTLVTTELIRRIAEGYGVQTSGNLLVGFKWIGDEMDRLGPERFVFGAEESYGFLAGDHVRDKDGAVAAMLLAEYTARLKADGLTLHQKLDDLYRQYGGFAESQFSVYMRGEQGMEDMKALMARLHTSPPEQIAGMKIVKARDYLSGTITEPGGSPKPLDGPTGDMVIFDLELPGNYVAVRPSGTEPKVKFYMFAHDPPEKITDLAATKQALADRMTAMQKNLEAVKS